MPENEMGYHRRAQRPGSAWKNRHRRPRFTDNFDAFNDPVLDLDIEALNVDDRVDADATRDGSSSEVKTGVDVVRPRKELTQTPRSWHDNITMPTEHQLNMMSRHCSRQGTNTSSENWTSSEETTRRDSVEPATDFELSRIRAKVLEKYRDVPTETANQVVDLQSLNVKVIQKL